MSAKEYTGADDVMAKISMYPEDFRRTAEKLHQTIMEAGGTLYPRLWYGMPGYAKTETSAVLVYFRKDKYVTFGQTESAHLDFDSETRSAGVQWFFDDINDAALEKIAKAVRNAIR